ncbi:MAG TPA: glycosyltransferase family 4 protein [Candidatus Binatia bacterium]|nr:glycosyltransferase family 4 protein [Candidatus Binatia bacterium]
MHIALITIEYITERSFAGGLANYTHRIARGLRKLGHDAEVFVPGSPRECFEHDGITIHRVKVCNPIYLRLAQRLLRVTGCKSFPSYIDLVKRIWSLRARLKKRHRECPFDLVHYTHLQGTGVLRTSLPTVVRLSSYRELVRPFGFYFTSPFEGFLEDLALKRADAVFGPSPWVADFVRSKLQIPVTVIESPFVAPNGYEDTSILDKHRLSRKVYGLYFGSLAEWKGVFVLAEALKSVLAEHENLHFVFVGKDLSTRNGKRASAFILEELRDFKDRVLRLDAMKHAQLFPIIRNADFVVLPSLADNFPNTCLEAMAVGKIVVGTLGRGFDQLIQDGENGLLCEPGNVQSLSSALRRAATMCEADKQRMAKLAQDRVAQLAPDKVVTELLSFYKEVVNRKRASRLRYWVFSQLPIFTRGKHSNASINE